jgi:hypothetical protein
MTKYAIYDKEDMIVYSGTAPECAKFLGISINSFFCHISRKKRSKGYYLYKVNDEVEQ